MQREIDDLDGFISVKEIESITSQKKARGLNDITGRIIFTLCFKDFIN